MEQKKEVTLQEGNIYLMKVYDIIFESYVEKITKTSYKFRIQKTDGLWYIDWVDQSYFNKNYKVIELLCENKTPPKLNYNNDLLNSIVDICLICRGEGQIPDDTTTAGKKICPKCWGTGNV